VVAIEGSVVRTGRFPWHKGMRVSELLKLGDGFLLNASLERATLIRRLGNERSFDMILGDGRGRVREEVIHLNLTSILAGQVDADITLERLDRLRILSRADVQDLPTVTIIGGVRKPGAYRLTSGMTLSDLLHLAGGPTKDAFIGTSNLVRRSHARAGRHFDVALIPFRLDRVMSRGTDGRVALKNFDQVVIRKVQSLQVRVEIEGRVQFPGTYILPDGSRISDLLAQAGGLLDKADLRGAVFTRDRIKMLQQQRLDDLFARSEEHFAQRRNMITRDGRVNEAVASHLSFLGLDRIVDNMKRFQAHGRVVLDFTSDKFRNGDDDLLLESGDALVIPRRMNAIVVMGRVFYPNAFVRRSKWTVEDYVEKAGGLQPDADTNQIYVVMASGEVRSAIQRRGGDLMRFTPGPGDTILIPAKPLERNRLSVAMDHISLIRALAEVGLIGTSIPRVADQDAAFGTGLDMGTAPQPVPTSIGSPYDQMLIREKGLRTTK
jgi:polysaccharide biosynthesis/export protein